MKRSALILASLSLVAITCKKEPPPAVQIPALALVAEDASCTEAWLRISTVQVPATVRLVRDGQPVSLLSLRSSDSLVIDEGLLPRRTYTYKAELLEPQTPNLITSTPAVQVTTMDTTSHNFTWQIDTLGDGGGSVLYDVAIINDTLAYAVGEIYKRDSTGNWDPLPYNLVKWNGQRWELKKVTVDFRGSQVTVPLEGIFAHSATDIWLAGSIPIHGNGTNWIGYDIQTLVGAGATVSKAWGTSSEMYFVGRAGNIIHYDGLRWRRVESGTGLDIFDIWGDLQDGAVEVLAVASRNSGGIVDRKVLKVTPGEARAINDSGIGLVPLTGVWFSSKKSYYAVGSGIYRKRRLDEPRWVGRPLELTEFYSRDVDGNTFNDIVVAGAFGDVLHFNGSTWKQYVQTRFAGGFMSVCHRGNIVVGVGYLGNQRAVAVIGRHQ
jgi:hypothetical protein